MAAGSSTLSGEAEVPAATGRALPLERFVYNDAIVRAFLMITGALGHRGHAGRTDRGGGTFLPRAEHGAAIPVLRAVASAAYECGHFRFRRQRHLRRRLSLHAAALQGPALSDFLSWFHFWGWQLIIVAAAVPCRWAIRGQGICRVGMAHRPVDRRRVGGVRRQFLWHDASPAASGICTWPCGFTWPRW